MQTRLLYTFWLLFAAIYFLHGAATGKLSKTPKSKRYWSLSRRGRFLCLVVGITCAVGTILAFLSIFAHPSSLVKHPHCTNYGQSGGQRAQTPVCVNHAVSLTNEQEGWRRSLRKL